MTSTQDQPITIMEAITVPGDFPVKVAAFLEQLNELETAVRELTERIGTEVMPIAYNLQSRPECSEENLELFGEVTGWEPLSSRLLDLAGCLHAAAGDRPEWSSPPWWDRFQIGAWERELATVTDAERRETLQRWLGRDAR